MLGITWVLYFSRKPKLLSEPEDSTFTSELVMASLSISLPPQAFLQESVSLHHPLGDSFGEILQDQVSVAEHNVGGRAVLG